MTENAATDKAPTQGILLAMKDWYHRKYESNQVLTVFVTGMIVMMIVCAICAIITGGSSFLYMLHPNPPYVFMDHFSMVTDASDHPYTKHGEIYPPLAIICYAIIGHFTIPFTPGSASSWEIAKAMRDTEMPMMVFMVLIFAILISFYLLYQKFTEKELTRPGYNMLFITLLFSYPVLFGLSTGNCIFVAVLCCILYLYGYDSENKWIRYLSYIALGVAAGFKITPAFLAVLTLKRKGWVETGKCVAIVSALLLVPFVFTDGDPISYVNHVLSYASSVPSVFGFLNLNDLLDALGLDIIGALFIEIIVLGIFLMVILMDEEMERWEEATLLGGMLMLIFSVSVSYTLIYMELGLMLLLTAHKKIEDKGMILCIICFIGIFALIPGFELAQKYVGSIKMICMLVLILFLFSRSVRRQIRHTPRPQAAAVGPVEETVIEQKEPEKESEKEPKKSEVRLTEKRTEKIKDSKKNNKAPRRSKSGSLRDKRKK